MGDCPCEDARYGIPGTRYGHVTPTISWAPSIRSVLFSTDTFYLHILPVSHFLAKRVLVDGAGVLEGAKELPNKAHVIIGTTFIHWHFTSSMDMVHPDESMYQVYRFSQSRSCSVEAYHIELLNSEASPGRKKK